MSNLSDNTSGQELNNQSLDFRTELEKYLIHWKWFLLSSFLSLCFVFLFLKTKHNVYETKASVLIKEDGGASTDLKAFQDLSSLNIGVSSNVYDEIEVLNSRSLAQEYVKLNNLNFEIFRKGTFKDTELYEDSPIKYKVLSNKEAFYKLDTFIDVSIIDNYTFSYKIENSEELKVLKFGEKIVLGKHELVFLPNLENKSNTLGDYKVFFRHIDGVVEKYRASIQINSADKYSNIILMSMKYPVKKKSQDILNALVDLYSKMSIDDQNLVGQKTDKFIKARLEVITKELDEIDKIEEIYKSDKQITDISLQSQVFVDAKSDNEQVIFKKEAELSLINFVIKDIDSKSNELDLLPTVIATEETPQLSLSIVNYNNLLLERNRIQQASTTTNPIVVNLNTELKSLLENIKVSLDKLKKQIEISLASLSKVEKGFEKKISSLPKQAREYRGILRRQEIIAELYSYLLQKKEENEISMAVTVSTSKVVDRAYSYNMPVSPNKKVYLLGGLLIGLAIPSLIIYLIDLLDTKLKSKKDLEEVLKVPLVGDIPLDKSGDKIVISKGSRTSAAEAFRLLRTNLDFMLTSVQTTCKTIFVTSTISGEGKTFVAVNLGASIALTGKKVLIIGMDLRAPKITQYLDLPNRNGVTNYLVDKNIELEDLIFKMDGFDNLHLLSSGVVPPNPAELLLNNRVSKLFEELKGLYDYIVVDTAPVNLVTDTLMISHHADMVLYTTRANYLDKRFLEVPERLYQEKRLPNMAILLNGLDYTRGYGYGYGGYGYPKEHEHKSFFQKIFRK